MKKYPEDYDTLFDTAKEIVLNRKKISVDNLLKELGVGYARGTWIIQELEGDGIVVREANDEIIVLN